MHGHMYSDSLGAAAGCAPERSSLGGVPSVSNAGVVGGIIHLSEIKKKQQNNYEQYLDDVDDRNLLKRGRAVVSPFVMGYGLAVIASASISAALLSIERNTRKKEG